MDIIEKQVNDFQVDDIVFSPAYGTGTVVSVDDKTYSESPIRVYFQNGGYTVLFRKDGIFYNNGTRSNVDISHFYKNRAVQDMALSHSEYYPYD